jgi:regulator of replication initiation timing
MVGKLNPGLESDSPLLGVVDIDKRIRENLGYLPMVLSYTLLDNEALVGENKGLEEDNNYLVRENEKLRSRLKDSQEE